MWQHISHWNFYALHLSQSEPLTSCLWILTPILNTIIRASNRFEFDIDKQTKEFYGQIWNGWFIHSNFDRFFVLINILLFKMNSVHISGSFSLIYFYIKIHIFFVMEFSWIWCEFQRLIGFICFSTQTYFFFHICQII